MLFKTTLNVLLLAFSAVAYTIRGSIDDSVLPLDSNDFATTKIRLSSPKTADEESFLTEQGSFQFSSVKPGTYLLRLESTSLESQIYGYRIIVSSEDGIKVNEALFGHDWISDVGPVVEFPVLIEPMRKKEYLKERDTFDLLAMIKNPMVLISLVSLVFVFYIPKILDNLDPEALAAIQNPQSLTQNLPPTSQEKSSEVKKSALDTQQARARIQKKK